MRREEHGGAYGRSLEGGGLNTSIRQGTCVTTSGRIVTIDARVRCRLG